MWQGRETFTGWKSAPEPDLELLPVALLNRTALTTDSYQQKVKGCSLLEQGSSCTGTAWGIAIARRGLGGERKPQGEAVSPVLYSGQRFRRGNETDNSRHAMEMKGSLLPGCAGETLAEDLCPVRGIRF